MIAHAWLIVGYFFRGKVKLDGSRADRRRLDCLILEAWRPPGLVWRVEEILARMYSHGQRTGGTGGVRRMPRAAWIPAFGDLCVTPRGGRGREGETVPANLRSLPWIPDVAGMTGRCATALWACVGSVAPVRVIRVGAGRTGLVMVHSAPGRALCRPGRWDILAPTCLAVQQPPRPVAVGFLRPCTIQWRGIERYSCRP